jgi:hypothetical protein
VRVKLYKGNVIVVGRDSKTDSLFDPTIATFEDDAGAYDQKDAAGFIKLNALLRMRIARHGHDLWRRSVLQCAGELVSFEIACDEPYHYVCHFE